MTYSASKSNSLASKSKSLASKASSLASKSASVASCAAASSASASRAAASLASQQSLAARSASSLSSVASSASAASAAAASAQASLDSALAAFSSSQASAASAAGAAALAAQSSLAAAKASISADAAAVASASAVEAGVSASLVAASTSFAAAQASATASIAAATQSIADAAAAASSSLAQAQASISTASAAAAQASLDAASSSSVLASRSSDLDSASASFTSYSAQVTSSFGSVSSALAASQSAVDSSASGLSITLASVSVAQSEISVSATALATQSINQASAASVASVQATASGLATACKLPAFLGNGHCYSECPAAYPIQFTRDNTNGLCCTEGSTECIAADATAATVCDNDHLFTVLDYAKMTGTCTEKCTTVGADGTAYAFLQNGGAVPECVAAPDCAFGAETADLSSSSCCASGVATCKDQSATGALTCTSDKMHDVVHTSCVDDCPEGTVWFFNGGRECRARCPVVTGVYTAPWLSAQAGSAQECCGDANAKTCKMVYDNTKGWLNPSLSCVDGYVLGADDVCVAAGHCAGAAKDNGLVCCPDGALTCSSRTVALTCGLNAAGEQTYLTSAGACATSCANGKSVLADGTGVCCKETGSLTCSSGVAAASLTCDASSGYYLLPSTAGGSVGSCKSQCAGAYFDSATSQCVSQCATSTSFFSQSSTGRKTCCGTGVASCTASGPTTCLASAGYFLQPDGQSCLKTCPSDSAHNSAGGFCCAKGTSTCSGVALHGEATKCTSEYYLLDSTCLSVCPVNTIPATDASGNKVCSCIGKSFTSCAYDGAAQGCTDHLNLVASASGAPATCQSSCFYIDYTVVAALGPSWEGIDNGRGGLAGCKAHCQAKGGEEAYGAWSPDSTYTHTFCTCYTTAPEAGGPVSPVDMAQCGDRDPTDRTLPMGSYVNNRASIYLL